MNTEAAQLYLILHQSCLSLKSDHQDLLRSVCFQKLYFHCSSAEEWSSSHIFWGAFISSALNQHCIICLDHFHLILLRHIIGDIEQRLIFRSFYVSICYKDLIDLHHKHQNFIIEISASAENCMFLLSLSLWAVFPQYSHYIRLYEP